MPKKVTHDDLFKATFSYPAEVEALVRSCLPEYFGEHLDFSTLQQENTAYISAELRQYFADMCYSCFWKADSGGEPVQIALLLEHKSSQPDNIYIQLLRYLTETYQHQYQQKLPLRLVVPIVVYHGKQRWRRRSFGDYFPMPDPRLAHFLPAFDYELVDINHWANDVIINMRHGYYIKSTFLLFKHHKNKAAIQRLSQKIFIFAEEVTLSQEEKLIFLRQLLTYIFSVFSFNTEEFIQLTKQLPDMAQDVAYSTFDRILDEGIAKGKIEGKEEGRSEAMFITLVEEDFRWIIKMQEQLLDIAIVQALSELPEDFLVAFFAAYTTDKGTQLMDDIAAMRALSGLDALANQLQEVLLGYGLSEEEVEAYRAHLAERLKARE